MANIVERIGDMHPTRGLRVLQQKSGDVIVVMTQDQTVIGDFDTGNETDRSAQVEFCLSGGRSRHTLQALLNLKEAMERDNRERPIAST